MAALAWLAARLPVASSRILLQTVDGVIEAEDGVPAISRARNKELDPMAGRGSADEIRRKALFRLEQAEQRRRDAEKSLAEHKAKSNAVAANTIRLRALRLAKEARDAADKLAAADQRAAEGVSAAPKARSKKKADLGDKE